MVNLSFFARNRCLFFLLSALALNTSVAGAIRHDDKLISGGDSLENIYRIWGKPQYKIKTSESCYKVISLKKKLCSKTRKVWQRDDMYWLVQHKGNVILQIDWTRFESQIREKM